MKRLCCLFCLLVVGLGSAWSPAEPQASAPRESATWYVSTAGSDFTGDGSVGNPFGTIQYAIDQCLDGDEVWVKPGVFSGPGNRDINLLGKAIVVRSEDDNPACCIIDCGGNPADPHRGFILDSLETATTILSGLTIRNGYAEFGGGIYLGDPDDQDASVAPTIMNCILESNQVVFAGGGMYIYQGSSPLVSNCLFRENSALDGGGIYLYWYSNAVFTSCVFERNTAIVNGGGITAMWEQFNSYVDCVFDENSAVKGGAYCNPAANSKRRGDACLIARISDTFTNCEFTANTADHGGACYLDDWSTMSFADCHFESNLATLSGGAIYDGYSHNSYTGCIFAHNTAPTGGAMMITGDDIPFAMTGVIITGSTFAFNSGTTGSAVAFTYANLWEIEIRSSVMAFGIGGEAINITGPGTPLVSCTDIFGNAGGDWTGNIAPLAGVDGNISVDPGFCQEQAPADPYTLEAESPCAAGNNPDCGQIGGRPVGCDGMPSIDSVTDIAGDQGGWVTVTWRRCGYDRAGSLMAITEYDIYRETALPNNNRLSPGTKKDLPGWDIVATMAATQDSTYQIAAPTVCDSTISQGPYSSTFIVSAMSSDPAIHFDSLPAVGYSTDNLSPAAATGFTVEYQYDRNLLNWDAAVDADFMEFMIYRTLATESPPNGASIPIETAVGTAWTDVMTLPESNPWQYRYWLATVDSAGNSSTFVGPDGLTPVGLPKGPPRTVLYGNAPNPFNPTTIIRFDLATGMTVDLKVFDIAGRVVRTLIGREEYLPGQHQAFWNGEDLRGRPSASGVYFCRLQAGKLVQTRTMLLVR